MNYCLIADGYVFRGGIKEAVWNNMLAAYNDPEQPPRILFQDDNGFNAVDLDSVTGLFTEPEDAEPEPPEAVFPASLASKYAELWRPGDAVIEDEAGKRVEALPDGLYFLSHPFTHSEQDPEYNQADANRLAGLLEDTFPGIRIFDPINSHLGYKVGAALKYPNEERAMTQCLTILSATNGVLVCEDWKQSSGCRDEVEKARVLGIPLYFAKG